MEEKKKGFFSRLVDGLAKTRDNIVSGMDTIFSGFSAIDEEFYEELEETLIMGDLGIRTTASVMEDLRKRVKEQHIKEPGECRQLLIDSIKDQMNLGENAYEFENRTSVVLVIGVNGVGKTTSVGKLAGQGLVSGNDVAVFTAMCMCWSGYLSTHVSMMNSLECNHLVGKAIGSHTVGGLCAGVFSHWLYGLLSLI